MLPTLLLCISQAHRSTEKNRKQIDTNSFPTAQVQNGNPPPAPAFLATLPKSAFEALLLAKSHF